MIADKSAAAVGSDLRRLTAREMLGLFIQARARQDGGQTRAGSPPSEPVAATTLREQYVWSPRYVDSPILRDRDADGDGQTGHLGQSASGLEERLYYLTDGNHNVTALVQGTPGSQHLGQVVERYSYDPYGRATVLHGVVDASGSDTSADHWQPRTSGDFANAIRYCGYRWNPVTGLYHVRHRVYHPLLGRWVQRDPLDYVDGVNLYEYCGGMPIDSLDPLGLSAWDWVWGGVKTGAIGTYRAGRNITHGVLRMAGDQVLAARDTAVLAGGGVHWLHNIIWHDGQPPRYLAEVESHHPAANQGYLPRPVQRMEDVYDICRQGGASHAEAVALTTATVLSDVTGASQADAAVHGSFATSPTEKLCPEDRVAATVTAGVQLSLTGLGVHHGLKAASQPRLRTPYRTEAEYDSGGKNLASSSAVGGDVAPLRPAWKVHGGGIAVLVAPTPDDARICEADGPTWCCT